MSMETRQAFGRRVRALRTESGFSLRKFALAIGADKSYLVDVEYGRKSPTLDTVERIARGLDVSMSYLLEGVDTVGPIEYDGEQQATRRANAPDSEE
ncbi:helix-turn-helix domain-containing protein [Olsenella sp. An188]|uniref:helix-turn-helix domain-containing protein n=1 Tax=Olsenella sp. An188 TaxID=1965579 RepID=UPI00315A49BC